MPSLHVAEDFDHAPAVAMNTSLLPDLQLILDPANNPEKDSVWSVGIRLRLII